MSFLEYAFTQFFLIQAFSLKIHVSEYYIGLILFCLEKNVQRKKKHWPMVCHLDMMQHPNVLSYNNNNLINVTQIKESCQLEAPCLIA